MWCTCILYAYISSLKLNIIDLKESKASQCTCSYFFIWHVNCVINNSFLIFLIKDENSISWFEGIIATYDGLKGMFGIYFPSNGETHFASLDDEDLEILEWVLNSSQPYDSSINCYTYTLLSAIHPVIILVWFKLSINIMPSVLWSSLLLVTVIHPLI